MDFIDIGWREGLLLAVAVVAVYLVVALLGLARLKRRRESVAVVEPPFIAGEPPDFLASSLSVRIDDDRPDVPGSGKAAGRAAGDGHGSDFAAQLARGELEAEVRQLRADVAALRRELGELRSERTPRRVSPRYEEAAALAERGFDARGVAEECGISVAEAELVLAMNRDEKTFDKEDDHDGIGYQAATEPAGR